MPPEEQIRRLERAQAAMAGVSGGLDAAPAVTEDWNPRDPGVRKLWRSLFDAQEGRCVLCNGLMDAGAPETIHVDHIVPLAKGGSNDRANLQAVHAACNLAKGEKGVRAADMVTLLDEGEEECPMCGGVVEAREHPGLMYDEPGTGRRVCAVCAHNELGVDVAYDPAVHQWVVRREDHKVKYHRKGFWIVEH